MKFRLLKLLSILFIILAFFTCSASAFFVSSEKIHVGKIFFSDAFFTGNFSPLTAENTPVKNYDDKKFASDSLLATKSGDKLVKVTSWADKGIQPDLNPGRWVMTGEPTKLNFWKSGLPGPKAYFTNEFPYFKIQKSTADFTNYITDFVPQSSLKFPSGIEIIKAPFGQRIIK